MIPTLVHYARSLIVIRGAACTCSRRGNTGDRECANLRVDAPSLLLLFLLGPFGPGASHGAGSVPPAIPLTRLRIVVLAREEDPMASTRVPVVRVSAYLRGDFGATSGPRRDKERILGERGNATRSELDRTRRRRNVVQCGCNVTELLLAIAVPARGREIVNIKPYQLLSV